MDIVRQYDRIEPFEFFIGGGAMNWEQIGAKKTRAAEVRIST